MGNKCNCVASQSTDEAEDALLGSEQHLSAAARHQQHQRSAVLPGRPTQTPRGPPPPYQQVNPFYLLTDEQRVQIMTRLTLIQSLPVGHYNCGSDDDKKKLPLEKELEHCEKSDKLENRECPICMNDFLPGDPIRLLPCMHYYHTRCIDEWLMRAITCPNCMQRVDVAFQRATLPPHHRRVHTRSVSRGSVTGLVTTTVPSSFRSVSTSPTRSNSSSEHSHASSSAPPTSPVLTPSIN